MSADASPGVTSSAQPSGIAVREPTRLGPLLPVYLVIFVAFIGYAMMVNFFVPLLMNDHGFLPADAPTSRRTIVVGLLLAVYPLGQFFGSPVLGAISDRFGRKPVLLISLAVAVVCYAVVAVAIQERSLVLLAIACLVGGLSESNIAIAQAAVADVARPEDRGRLFAYIYTACSCGYIAGPLLGGQIARVSGFSLPFWIVTALLAIAFIWVARSFQETHPADRTRRIDYGVALTNLLTVFTDRAIRLTYLINFLIYLTLFGYFRVIIVYMVDTWHMLSNTSTFYYSYCALMSMVASLVLTGPLLSRFGAKRLGVGSALAAGLLMIVIVVPPSVDSLWFTAGPAALIGTLTLASCATLLSSSVSADRQGQVMGNNQALQVGGEAIGSLVGGLLAAIVVPLPLVAFGIILMAAGLMLATRSDRAGQPT